MKRKEKRFFGYRGVEEEFDLKRSFMERHPEVPRYRVGRRVFFKREDIENWLEEHRQESTNSVRQLVNQIVEKVRGKK
jgi:hypothetical protein